MALAILRDVNHSALRRANREVAAQLATPAESAATAADLLEEAVRLGH